MTQVTCRCGHTFETEAKSRTTCRICKRAVTVPRSVAYEEAEASGGSARGLVAVAGLVVAAWGGLCVSQWRKEEPTQCRRDVLVKGVVGLVLGVGLLYLAARTSPSEET